jgi:hypothetical protein
VVLIHLETFIRSPRPNFHATLYQPVLRTELSLLELGFGLVRGVCPCLESLGKVTIATARSPVRLQPRLHAFEPVAFLSYLLLHLNIVIYCYVW